MREAVAAVAGPKEWSDTRETWNARAARRANVSYRQAKALFYGEITDPEHKAVRRMRDAAVRYGQAEAQEMAARFETIAEAMNAGNADRYSKDIAALLDAARALRGLAGAGTDGG